MMSKFTFICDDSSYTSGSSKNTFEFEDETLSSVLENFERFLRGSGFHFDGHVTIENDDYSESEETYSPVIDSMVDSLMNDSFSFGAAQPAVSILSNLPDNITITPHGFDSFDTKK